MPPHYTKKYTEPLPDTCGACGRMGHRNTAANPCPLPPVPWDRLGIEVEGFWEGLDRFQAAKDLARSITGTVGVSDGSLRSEGVHECEGMENDGECDCDNTQDTWYAWEFRGRPGNITEAASQLMRLYPDGTNHSVGMHVHASFKSSVDIALFKSTAFFEYWAARWDAWGKKNKVRGAFWERLAGVNQYCKPNALEHLYDRYRQLNFERAWEAHETLECRLLPMFQSAKLTLRGLYEVCDIYDSWLTGRLFEAHMPRLTFQVSDDVQTTHDADVEWVPPPPPEPHAATLVLETYHDVPEPGCAMQPRFIANDYVASHMIDRAAYVMEPLRPRPDPALAVAAAPPPPPLRPLPIREHYRVTNSLIAPLVWSIPDDTGPF